MTRTEGSAMNDEDILSDSDFKRCVEFHGHVCPGLAIGFQAARILMDKLGVQKASDEELLAFVENDACGVDAIQVMTGCSFGKGNLIFKNHGKHAFTLVARKRRDAFRACLRPDVFKPDPEHLALFEKVQQGDSSPAETTRFKELQMKRTREVLTADPETLFKVGEISIDIPPKARITESAPCDLCGESTKVDLLCEIGGQRLCIPCAQSPAPEAREQ